MATTRTSVQQSAKLQVPVAAGDLIDRARLRERLDTLVGPGGGTRVLAVCAPAGFGKTTAVSGWARGVDPARVPIAWCSLDATESHTFRFWSLVLQAVTAARPELAQAGLAAPHRAGAAGFLNELVEALAGHPLVLVLENLHELIDLKVLADLDRFVGLLPDSVKLVLTSRSDPPLTALQALHLRGELAQLRVRDLAFTPGELRLLAPDLDEEKRQLIWDRTDGWPALVSLMLLSLRTHSELPLTPVEDDYVMAEYLFRELLRRQDPRVQSLMLVAGLPDLLAARPRRPAVRHDRCGPRARGPRQRPRAWSRGRRRRWTTNRGTGSTRCCAPTCGPSWCGRTASESTRCMPRQRTGSSTPDCRWRRSATPGPARIRPSSNR